MAVLVGVEVKVAVFVGTGVRVGWITGVTVQPAMNETTNNVVSAQRVFIIKGDYLLRLVTMLAQNFPQTRL